MSTAETSLQDVADDRRPWPVVGGAATGVGHLPALLAPGVGRGHLSRRCRRVVLVAAVMDGVVDWLRRGMPSATMPNRSGCSTYLLLKRIDDLAYGLGLWTGVVRERNVGALKPQIRT